MIPNAVKEWLQRGGHGEVVRKHALGGGCINNGARLETARGDTFFLKTNNSAPEDMFTREAEGLKELRNTGRLRFPDPYLWGTDFLLMEDLESAPHAADYWSELGCGLALLHSVTSSRFGFEHDNYLGSTRQPNVWTEDGHVFFAAQRLGFQTRLARDKGWLTGGEASQVERLATRLPELVPQQSASLLHGDLWAGNAIADRGGQPALIDPATHFGWPEAELGMTALFGGFEPRFYTAYEEVHPLESGWRQRLPIYNLYHLLNHLNIFGAGYHGQVMAVVKAFA